MRPLFSCVVPVKGERPFIKEALASLETQGMGGDLEIIVQDASGEFFECSDCSIVRLKNEGVNIRWEREPDRGQSDALNKGFAKAQGEWLFWLNADDVLLPGALQKIKAVIHSTTTTSDYNSLSWIAGNQIYIDERGRVLKCLCGNGWHDWLYRHAVPHVYGPSAFFRHELFEKVKGFDTSLHVCMDWDLWIRFMKAGARFHRIDEYLWAMRQWTGSKTQGDSRAAGWHGEEVARMLAKNEFVITRGGVLRQRLWRILDGSYLCGWVDTLRTRGRAI